MGHITHSRREFISLLCIDGSSVITRRTFSGL